MTFFKINKQTGEDNLEDHPSSEQNTKGIAAAGEETLGRKENPFKADAKAKQRKGTITVMVSTTVQEVARFQVSDPSLFQRTIEIVSGVLSQIDEPQVEISGDCNCIWCQQKISEIKEALSS